MLIKNIDTFVQLLDTYKERLKPFQITRFVEALKKYNPDVVELALIAQEQSDGVKYSIDAIIIEEQDGVDKYNSIFVWWHNIADEEISIEGKEWKSDFLSCALNKENIILFQDSEFIQKINERQIALDSAIDKLIENYEKVADWGTEYKERGILLKQIQDIWENVLDNNSRLKAYAKIDKSKLSDFYNMKNYHKVGREMQDLFYPIKIDDKWYGYDLCFKTFYTRNGKKEEVCLIFRGIEELEIKSANSKEFAAMQRPIIKYIQQMEELIGSGFGVIGKVCMPLANDGSTCITLEVQRKRNEAATKSDEVTMKCDEVQEQVYNIFKEILILQENF